MYYIGSIRDGVDFNVPYPTLADAKRDYEAMVNFIAPHQAEIIQMMLEHRNWQAEPADPDYRWLRMAHDDPSRIDEAAEGMVRSFFYITDAGPADD